MACLSNSSGFPTDGLSVNSSRVEFELPMLEVGVRVPVHASNSPSTSILFCVSLVPYFLNFPSFVVVTAVIW